MSMIDININNKKNYDSHDFHIVINDINYVVSPDGTIGYILSTDVDIPNYLYSTNVAFLTLPSVGVGDVYNIYNSEYDEILWEPIYICEHSPKRLPIAELTHCPVCDSDIFMGPDEIAYCLNDNCQAKLAASLHKFLTLTTMGLFTLQEKQTIASLVYSQILNICDLFTLTEESFYQYLTRQNSRTLFDKIQSLKGNITLGAYLLTLNFPNTTYEAIWINVDDVNRDFKSVDQLMKWVSDVTSSGINNSVGSVISEPYMTGEAFEILEQYLINSKNIRNLKQLELLGVFKFE